jgi:membrane protease subunit HflC
MKAQKILLPIIAVIGALVFFSVFIVKEVNPGNCSSIW